MPTLEHIAMVADRFGQRLHGLACLPIERSEATDSLRQVSGESGTRIKCELARKLDTRLLEIGIFAMPRFQDTTTGAAIRLYRVGTEAAHIADVILHPSQQTDISFAEIITKAKGKANWAPSSGRPGTPVAPFSYQRPPGTATNRHVPVSGFLSR